ncbi:MAG: ABC transporter permease [Chloroflexi bacterium]|nr:ABC transporter permease [Chloroflexota bacterium]
MTNWLNIVSRAIEWARRLGLVALLGVVALFTLSGLAQLYLDLGGLEGDALDGLVPTVDELQAAWDTHHDTLMDVHVPATLWATLTGLAIAIGLGLGLAAVMDLVPLVRWLLYPVLVLSQTIPTFAIAVILILIFGFEFGPKIVVVILFTFYPITISTLNGLQSTERNHIKLLKSMGANPLQVWWKVRLPTAMPSFFSGLRLAATYAVVGAVIGEYVGAGDGLGKFLQRSYRSFRTDQVYLAVIIIAALSITLVVTMMLVEVLALRWRYVGQGRDLLSQWQRLKARVLE